MTTTVAVVTSDEPAVVAPDLAAALQAALAYLTANRQAAAKVQALVVQAQNAEAGAQAAADLAQSLLSGPGLSAALVTLFQALPTTRPPTAGKLWNNSGALSLT